MKWITNNDLLAFNFVKAKSSTKTGFNELDNQLNFIQANDFIVIAGRPSSGKTILSCKIALSSALSGNNTAVISSELRNTYLFNVSNLSTSSTNFRKHLFITQIKLIDNIQEFVEKVEESIQSLQLELLVIDSVSSMFSSSNISDEFFREDLCNELKKLGISQNLPILITSDCRSDVEERGGCCFPYVQDIEVRTLQNLSTKILLLFRAELYDISHNEDGQSTEGVIDIFIKKNKGGALGSSKLRLVNSSQLEEIS